MKLKFTKGSYDLQTGRWLQQTINNVGGKEYRSPIDIDGFDYTEYFSADSSGCIYLRYRDGFKYWKNGEFKGDKYEEMKYRSRYLLARLTPKMEIVWVAEGFNFFVNERTNGAYLLRKTGNSTVIFRCEGNFTRKPGRGG